MALRTHLTVKLARKPRMADFAMWAVAAEPALGTLPGAFMQAYTANRIEADWAAIEASPIGPAIIELMDNRKRWEGTATELLERLRRTPAFIPSTWLNGDPPPNHVPVIVRESGKC